MKLTEARERCLEAIGHVGKANYTERENEAIDWVNQVFDKLEACEKEAQEKVKEIFKEADMPCIHKSEGYPAKRKCRKCWQALKQKYLEK